MAKISKGLVINSNAVEISGNQNLTASTTNDLSANINGTLNGTLNIHYGNDGTSPTITVEENNSTTYSLRITDINGSFVTPNLKGKDGVDIPFEVASKVEKDLTQYVCTDLSVLTADQKEQSYLYLYRNDLKEPETFKLNVLSTKEETKNMVDKKLRTVKERPINWSVGDYIFLEKLGEE